MSSSKRMAKRLLSVILTIMMLVSMITIGMVSTAAAAPETIYLKPGVWSEAGAIFRAWVWGGTTADKWIYFADTNGDGVYEADLGGSYTGMKILRSDPTATGWTSWNDSGDQTIPTDGKNCFVVNGWGSYSWSTYTPPAPAKPGDASAYYLMGTLSDWSTGTNMVYSENTDVLTVTFEDVAAGDYEFKVKTGSNWIGASQLGTTIDNAAGGTISNADNVTLKATGGTYTFNYTLSTGKMAIVYTAPVVPTTTVPATTTTPVVTTTPATDPDETTAPATSDETTPATVPATTAPATTVTVTTTPVEEVTVDLAWAEDNGLYAYAEMTKTPGEDAWQRWVDVNGTRRFYLPASASATEVLIYSTYAEDVTVNGVTIAPGEFAAVPYTEGATITCSGATDQKVVVYKTDAEASLFVNAADGMTAKYDGSDSKVDKDASFDIMAFFRSGSKNQEIAKAGGAVADINGVIDEQIKKMKGRGNTTWSEEKKPFNITFKNAVSVDDMLAGTKWSLLANAKDASLLRNRLVYDMANEVNMKYACDSRIVDFFVNGRYEGSYQLTQKIEMGEGTVMPDLVEPDEDNPPTENFDFILELDTASNASSSNDTYRETSRKQVMTFKTPGEPTDEQITWAMAKYQAVEDALYGNDMETLSKLVDIDDLAKAYLINEISKNIDAGVTSCYFTYNSAEDKFYLSPVWDFDNAVGNLASGRSDVNGNALDLATPSGWYAREMAHFDTNFTGKRSVFSMAWYTTTETADGETFAKVVERVWNEEFVDLVDILEGTTDGNGRLLSADTYMSKLAKSGQWNYDKGWTLKQDWTASHSSLTMYDYDAATNTITNTTKSYDVYDAQDMNQYAADWLISRINWMAAQYASAEDVIPEGSKTVYVGVITYLTYTPTLHYWNNNTGLAGDATLTATGETEQFAVGSAYWNNAKQTFNIYKGYIPAEATGMKTWDGNSTWAAEEVTYADDQIILLFEYGGTHHNFTAEYVVEEPTTTTPVETTTTPVETTTTPAETTTPATSDQEVTDPTETTTTPVESSSTPVAEEKTMTIYFENNWNWPDLTIYWWGSETGTNPAWKTQKMTKVDTTKDGYDRYVIEVPTDVDGIIFAGTGDFGFEQSADITSGWYDGICYYMTYDSATGTKPAASYKYEPLEGETTTTPVETTTTPTETTTPATSDQEVTDPTETTTPKVEYITVFAVNSAKWDNVSAYVWTDSPAVAWPGEAMDFVGVDDFGRDVYSYTFANTYTSIIFNNGLAEGAKQTDDLTPVDGQYYDLKTAKWYETLAEVPGENPLSTNRYLVGSFNGWSTLANEFMLKAEGDKIGYVTLTLDANTEYEFKIVRDGSWTSCKETLTITDTVSGLTFSTSANDNGNVVLTTKDAGEYVFAFNVDNSQLAVTYPGTTPATPDEEETDTTVKLAGDFTDPAWADGAIEMTLVEEGGTVYETELRFEAGEYKFKMIKFGEWLGNNGTIENTCEGWTFRNGVDADGNEYGNATLVATGGTYTFTFDTATDKLTITAVLDEIPAEVYDVTFNEGHFTVNAPATIDEGATLEFTVEAEEGFVIAAVIVDMATIDAIDGVYTIENVTGDVYIMVVAAEESTNDTPIIPAKTWTVMFVDYDNSLIAVAKVEDGKNLPAPAAPERAGYEFTGWSQATDNVTKDMIVVAQYKKIVKPVEPATIGSLKVDVTGGTGFMMTIDGVTRPQGTTYYNSKMAIGTTVTVTAFATDGATFVGWANANNLILSANEEYTFVTTGSDQIKAIYETKVENVGLVIFKNNMSNQILDMQYYASTDAIVFPESPVDAMMDFTGWTMSESEILAAIANGETVTVETEWTLKPEYVTVTVVGGTATGLQNENGQFQKGAAMTVTADAAPEGKSFAYWMNGDGKVVSYETEYKLYPKTDISLTAVFAAEGEELDYQVLVSVDSAEDLGVGIQYSYSWYTPVEQAGFTHQAAGIICVLEADYNEDNFTVDSANIKKYTTKATDAAATSKQGVLMTSGQTWYTRAWVQYLDADGNLQYAYSDIVVATKA